MIVNPATIAAATTAKGVIMTFIGKLGWTTVVTALLVTITWCAVPIFIRQDKVDWNRAISKLTSPFGVIGILGLVWGAYLILKEIKKKT